MILYCKIFFPEKVSYAKITFDGSKCIYAETPLKHLEDMSFFDFTKFVRKNKWTYLISSKEFGSYDTSLDGRVPEDFANPIVES